MRERSVIHNVLNEAQVVLCTLNGASSTLLDGIRFNSVLIDECTQGLESECWIAIQKGDKLILAGDPLQLPPTSTIVYF
jgi:DNA polymerase alpha-associated DNA helicase A